MNHKYSFYTNDTNTDKRIHPRNWMYRVSGWLATFDGNRLKYNQLLIPLIYKGRCCLRINEEEIKQEFPEIFECVYNIIQFLDAKKLN